jgi:hypothetical protein
MSEHETYHKILINGDEVPTLTLDGDEWYTAFPITSGAVSITRVELIGADGEPLACFAFSQTFAVPKGE